MAEGITTRTDPETGEVRETRFEYTPTPPPDRSGMGGIDRNAVMQMFQEQQIEDAQKVLAAAIQFQGQRGYQQALKSGEPAEKAMAKYGPMIFYKTPQAFGPAQRALRPPPVKPNYEWVPGTNGAPDAFRAAGQRPVFPPAPPKVSSPFPELNFKAKQLDAEERSIMRKYPGPLAITMSPEDRAAIGEIQTRRKQLQPTPSNATNNAAPATDLSKQAAQFKTPSRVNEVIRRTKDGKRAIFNADTKDFLRYAD